MNRNLDSKSNLAQHWLQEIC